MTTLMRSVVGGVVGGVVGSAIGAVVAPWQMAAAAFAPVSYPIIGVTWGLVQERTSGNLFPKGVAPLFGAVVGVCLIPLAPLNFVVAPIMTPVTMGLCGVVAGVAIARSSK